MPARRFIEEIGSAAMLAAKRLAGVTPEMNLRNVTPQKNLCPLFLKKKINKIGLRGGAPMTLVTSRQCYLF